MNKAIKQVSMGVLVSAGYAQAAGSGHPGASLVAQAHEINLSCPNP